MHVHLVPPRTTDTCRYVFGHIRKDNFISFIIYKSCIMNVIYFSSFLTLYNIWYGIDDLCKYNAYVITFQFNNYIPDGHVQPLLAVVQLHAIVKLMNPTLNQTLQFRRKTFLSVRINEELRIDFRAYRNNSKFSTFYNKLFERSNHIKYWQNLKIDLALTLDNS